MKTMLAGLLWEVGPGSYRLVGYPLRLRRDFDGWMAESTERDVPPVRLGSLDEAAAIVALAFQHCEDSAA